MDKNIKSLVWVEETLFYYDYCYNVNLKEILEKGIKNTFPKLSKKQLNSAVDDKLAEIEKLKLNANNYEQLRATIFHKIADLETFEPEKKEIITILENLTKFDFNDKPYKVDIVDMQNISDNFKKIIEENKIPFPRN